MWRSLALITFIAICSIQLSWGQVYKTGSCMCELDAHLFSVRQSLKAGKDYPDIPIPTETPPPPRVETTIPSSNNTNSSSTSTTVNSNTTTTTAKSNTTATTTTAKSNTTSTTATPTSTTTATSSSTQAAGRRKRSVTSDATTTGEKSYDLGVMRPTGGVSYDSTIRLVSNGSGVIYDDYYNASLCNCTAGSSGKLSICFLNVMYDPKFDDPKSTLSRQHINRLLPWLDNIFSTSTSFAPKYLRTLPLGFSKFNDKNIQATFSVILNVSVYSPVYEIGSGFETKEVKNGYITIQGFKYETDIENEKGCYVLEDTTPSDPVPPPSLGDMRFFFLIAGFVLVIVLLLFVCCGKADKFYVRFW